jgi:hypothetical protein
MVDIKDIKFNNLDKNGLTDKLQSLGSSAVYKSQQEQLLVKEAMKDNATKEATMSFIFDKDNDVNPLEDIRSSKTKQKVKK